jgi:dephospho-CoA kinase
MLIGITGKIGSGKTTLANELVKNGFIEYSFSSPLKKIAEIFGFNKEHIYGTQEQKELIHPYWNVSTRDFLQKVGTELFRENLKKVLPNRKISDSIWIELFKQQYSKKDKYVVSDIRFLDEAKAIKDLGGIILKTFKNSDIVSNHKSETEIDLIEPDIIIDNNILKKEELVEFILNRKL